MNIRTLERNVKGKQYYLFYIIKVVWKNIKLGKWEGNKNLEQKKKFKIMGDGAEYHIEGNLLHSCLIMFELYSLFSSNLENISF